MIRICKSNHLVIIGANFSILENQPIFYLLGEEASFHDVIAALAPSSDLNNMYIDRETCNRPLIYRLFIQIRIHITSMGELWSKLIFGIRALEKCYV